MNANQILQVPPSSRLWFWRMIALAWLLVGLVIRQGLRGQARLAIQTLWWAVFGAVCTAWGAAAIPVDGWRPPVPAFSLRLPAGMFPLCWALVSLGGTVLGILELLGGGPYPTPEEP